MNVIHINTKERSGGAARAANRLHLGLNLLGVNSRMFVAKKESGDDRVSEFIPPPPDTLKLDKKLKKYIKRHVVSFKQLLGQNSNPYSPRQLEYYSEIRPSGYELFSDGKSIYKEKLIKQIPSSNIYHLHWIAGFIDYQFFFSNAAKLHPIVWTLHDMNAFTGGCHYDLGCGKYQTGCGKCPQLGSNRKEDLSSFIWNSKYQFFKKLPPEYLHIVTPSQWLGDQCKKSPFFSKFNLTVINNGLDTDNFSPRDRIFSRNILGIPQDTYTLLFAAESVNNRRKGFNLLMEALSSVPDTLKIHLLTIGELKTNINSHIPNTTLGQINNDRLLSLGYSAADLFIIPSIQDNLPNTVMESLSCGTPVIGFDVGGIREMIQDGITGFLVPPKNVEALRNKIMEASNTKILKKITEKCRITAVKNFTISAQAEKYIDLYNFLLNNTKHRQ